MKNYLAIAAIAMMAACNSGDQQATEEVKKDAPLAQSANTSQFNQSFGSFLNNYYSLKDALVATDSAKASAAANTLATSAETALSDLKADSAIILTAKDYVNNVSTSAKEIAAAKNVEAQRQAFQGLSENMYTLLQTVRYDQEVVYHQYCPMAFNDAGAFWLSNTSDIKNPYFGKKMLNCGEVKDSLDFRKK